jgi:uncharacterized membrane protein
MDPFAARFAVRSTDDSVGNANRFVGFARSHSAEFATVPVDELRRLHEQRTGVVASGCHGLALAQAARKWLTGSTARATLKAKHRSSMVVGDNAMDELFQQLLHITTRGIEAVGVLVIVVGALVAALNFVRERRASDGYGRLRATLGRAILLGLELLVAADIIDTVAIEPSLDSIAVLAGIILIRTFLSLSLEVEIEGRWPWQREKGREARPS